MQPRQSLSDGRAVCWTGPPDPQSIEKGYDRSGPARDLAKNTALAVFHRLRTSDAALGKMLHEPEKKRQIVFGNALFIECENEIAGTGMHQEIRILDAFRYAFVGEQIADVINRKEAGEIIRRDVGVDRHAASLRRLVVT